MTRKHLALAFALTLATLSYVTLAAATTRAHPPCLSMQHACNPIAIADGRAGPDSPGMRATVGPGASAPVLSGL